MLVNGGDLPSTYEIPLLGTSRFAINSATTSQPAVTGLAINESCYNSAYSVTIDSYLNQNEMEDGSGQEYRNSLAKERGVVAGFWDFRDIVIAPTTYVPTSYYPLIASPNLSGTLYPATKIQFPVPPPD